MAKRYFEFSEGTSNKFWEVWVEGSQCYTRYGKIGTSGQITLKDEGSPAGAQKLHDKLVREKTGKGYVEKSAAGSAAPAPAAPAKAAKKADAAPAPAKEAKKPKAEAAAAPASDFNGMRLEFTEDGSSKFWQISVSGNSYTATWGRIGTPGQSQTKTFGSEWEAKSERNKLVEEKKKKGYQVVTSGKSSSAAPSASASNPELEKQILSNPSEENYQVYADWLQSQGDARGELAAVQAQLAKSPKDAKLKTAEKRLLWDQKEHFYGALAPYVSKKKPEYGKPAIEAEWKYGFLDTLKLSATSDSGDDESPTPTVGDASELISLLPKVPSARFLRELVIRCPVAEDEFDFGDSIKALVKALPSLPTLKRLTLGDFDSEESELSWSHLGKLDALWPLLENLEYLKIHIGTMTLGPIKLPKCRELVIETGGLDKKNLKAILDAKWPALERLTLWFGQDEYGGNCSQSDLGPLLAGVGFSKLNHLGLANAPWGNELMPLLAKSKIVSQVKSLDISRSHLDTEGLKVLAQAKDKFSLDTLDVSECLLDSAGVKLAKTLAKNVETQRQEEPEDWWTEDDRDYRYTAVGE